MENGWKRTTDVRLVDANYLTNKGIRNCSLEEGGIPLKDFAVHQKILDLYPTVDAVVVPPLKIGDKAFFIIQNKIYEATISFLYWQENQHGISSEIRGSVQQYSCVSAPFEEWGKTVFATKEEAEKVLYPCEYCFCGTYRSCEGCSYGERRTYE